MDRLPFFVFVSLLPLLFSCEKQNHEPEQDDYFVFGIYYGFCQGNCTQIFKLQGDALYPDNIDRWKSDAITFSNESLPPEQVIKAKALRAAFPAALREEKTNFIGCPGCVDQGVYYIELSNSGNKEFWQIDTDTTQLPAYLIPFVLELEAFFQ